MNMAAEKKMSFFVGSTGFSNLVGTARQFSPAEIQRDFHYIVNLKGYKCFSSFVEKPFSAKSSSGVRLSVLNLVLIR